MLTTEDQAQLIQILDRFAQECYQNAVRHKFYDPPPSIGERLLLMHSEISEATEAYRKHILYSEHIPEYTGLEEELADVVIRILDFAAYQGLHLGEAIIAKMQFNETRPERHGGKLL